MAEISFANYNYDNYNNKIFNEYIFHKDYIKNYDLIDNYNYKYYNKKSSIERRNEEIREYNRIHGSTYPDLVDPNEVEQLLRPMMEDYVRKQRQVEDLQREVNRLRREQNTDQIRAKNAELVQLRQELASLRQEADRGIQDWIIFLQGF